MRRIYLALLIIFTILGSKLLTINFPGIGSVSLIMILVFITILYLIMVLSKKKKICLDKIQKNTGIVLFIIVIGGSIASAIYNINLPAWITYIVSFFIMISCMVFINNQKELIFCEKVLFFTIIFIMLIALYEIFTGNHIKETYESYAYQRNVFGLYKPNVAFSNINNFGIFLCIVTPICCNAIENFKKHQNLIKIIFLLLDTFVIISTNSRGAIIGIILFIMLHYRNIFQKYKLIYRGILIAFIVIFLMSMLDYGLFENKNTYSLEEEPRMEVWKKTIRTIINNYFIGVGPGNIAIYNMQEDSYNFDFGNPHNYFLEFLGDFGIIGFIAFIVWLYGIIKMYKKKIKTESDEKIKRKAENYYIYYIIFIISTITPSTMMTAQYIWLGFGFSLAFLSIYKKEGNNICQGQKNLYEI